MWCVARSVRFLGSAIPAQGAWSKQGAAEATDTTCRRVTGAELLLAVYHDAAHCPSPDACPHSGLESEHHMSTVFVTRDAAGRHSLGVLQGSAGLVVHMVVAADVGTGSPAAADSSQNSARVLVVQRPAGMLHRTAIEPAGINATHLSWSSVSSCAFECRAWCSFYKTLAR